MRSLLSVHLPPLPHLPSLKSLVSRSHGNFSLTVENFARQSFRLSSFLSFLLPRARVESLFLRSFIVSRFYRQTSCKSTERSLWREALMQTWRGGLGRGKKNMFLKSHGRGFSPSCKNEGVHSRKTLKFNESARINCRKQNKYLLLGDRKN